MASVVGVRFKQAGKVYSFDPDGLELKVNDLVVVKTTRGLEMGTVVSPPKEVADDEVDSQLKHVVRIATEEDLEHTRELRCKAKQAMVKCAELIDNHGLPMKLLSAEYDLSGRRLTFFFSAEERVDFRNLVKDLNNHFKVRVELRQVGSRDEAKLIGGFGRCGRPLCCMSFLSEFSPVSIKMAKEQSLPLNPMKISGICGRLMCCLSYESNLYHEMKSKLPRDGKIVNTPVGQARVVSSNPLKATVRVELESGATADFGIDEINAAPAPAHPTKGGSESERPARQNRGSNRPPRGRGGPMRSAKGRGEPKPPINENKKQSGKDS